MFHAQLCRKRWHGVACGPSLRGVVVPSWSPVQFSCCCTVLQKAAQARHAHNEHQRLEREHQHCLLAQYWERRECEAEQAALEGAKEAALQAEQAGLMQQCIFMCVFVVLQIGVCVIMSRLRLHCCHMAVRTGCTGLSAGGPDHERMQSPQGHILERFELIV